MSEDQLNIVKDLYYYNDDKYSMHKASEEFQELALIITQKLLKPTKVEDEAIIDEIGDCIIRLELIKMMYSNDKINERVEYKLKKFKQYMEDNVYDQI